MHSTPVSIASIARSLSIRKMRELTPPLSWRTRRRPFTVSTLGSRNGRLRTMARTSCSNSLPAVHRGNVTDIKASRQLNVAVDGVPRLHDPEADERKFQFVAEKAQGVQNNALFPPRP